VGQKQPPRFAPGGDGCSPISGRQKRPRHRPGVPLHTPGVTSGVPALGPVLQRGEEFNRLGDFRRGGEDRFRVGLHDAEPMVEILRVIGARRGRDAEVGAKESGAEVDKLFNATDVIAEAFAKLAIATRLRAREVRQLMEQGRVVGLGRRAGGGADECLARRKMPRAEEDECCRLRGGRRRGCRRG